jgi:hypothetical protein
LLSDLFLVDHDAPFFFAKGCFVLSSLDSVSKRMV